MDLLLFAIFYKSMSRVYSIEKYKIWIYICLQYLLRAFLEFIQLNILSMNTLFPTVLYKSVSRVYLVEIHKIYMYVFSRTKQRFSLNNILNNK